MSNKKHQAVIKLTLDGDQIKSNINGEKMDLYKMLVTAMENVKGFADVVVTAGQSYMTYLAKQSQSTNAEKKEA